MFKLRHIQKLIPEIPRTLIKNFRFFFLVFAKSEHISNFYLSLTQHSQSESNESVKFLEKSDLRCSYSLSSYNSGFDPRKP